jgi:hypothetical protein
MAKHSVQLQRLMFLFAIAGLFAVTADFACLEDVCAEMHTGSYRSMNDIMKDRVQTLNDLLDKSGTVLTDAQRTALARDGHLLGVLKVSQPVKHPDGTIEMPTGWLPEIPAGHPWARALTPNDDAYYSYIEERIFKAKLFDPANAEHQKAAAAYLAKLGSDAPDYVGWTYESRTECAKKMLDSGTKK